MPKTYRCTFIEEGTGEIAFAFDGIPAERLEQIAGFVRTHRSEIKQAAEVLSAAEAVKRTIADVARVAESIFGAPAKLPPGRGKR
jgi:hypothetical protein